MTGVDGLHVRFSTKFLRSPRLMALSDAAQALYVFLEAVALDERREFLPVEYDTEQIAAMRRRTVDETEEALKDIRSAARPLVATAKDGRIRMIGVREKHGLRFRWKDEREEVRDWNALHPNERVKIGSFKAVVVPGCAGAVKGKASRNVRSTYVQRTQNVHETSSPVEQKQTTGRSQVLQSPQTTVRAPCIGLARKLTAIRDPSLLEAARNGVGGILSKWGLNDFERLKQLDGKLRQRLKENPARVLAHVHEVNRTIKSKERLPILYSRLARHWGGKAKIEPGDKHAWPWARKIMQGSRKQDAEALGAVMRQAAGGKDAGKAGQS